MFTFSDCNIVLRSFGVYPTLGKFVLSASGGGEKTSDSIDLLEAETKIPTIKSPLTNNSAKHNLAFLEERRSPDERIRTNREPINIQCNNQSIKRGLICQYIKICWLHLLLHGHEAWKILKYVSAIFNRVIFFYYTVTLKNTSEFSFYSKPRGQHESLFRSCNFSLTFTR